MQFVISRPPVQVRALAPMGSTTCGFLIFSSPSKAACICRTFCRCRIEDCGRDPACPWHPVRIDPQSGRRILAAELPKRGLRPRGGFVRIPDLSLPIPRSGPLTSQIATTGQSMLHAGSMRYTG